MLNIFRGARPDITPAQIASGIPVLAVLLRVFGVYDITPEQQNALENAAAWGIALLGADAVVRFGRNYADGKTQAAAHLAAASAAPPVSDPPAMIDPETDSAPDDELPDDKTEFASPPPDAPRA